MLKLRLPSPTAPSHFIDGSTDRRTRLEGLSGNRVKPPSERQAFGAGECRLLAGQRPPQVAGQRLKRSESCPSSARSGVARRMAAYRCAVQLNVRFRVKPPSAGLADCPTSDFRERQLSDRSAAIARENVIRRLWVGGCPPSITPPAAPFSMERPARQSRGEPSPPRSTALRKRPPNLVRDPAVLDPKR